MAPIAGFKAYDIRGIVPTELNKELAYNVGRATAKFLNCKSVVIGHDVRESSVPISTALSNGFRDSGVNVIDLGLCGTEMIYYGTSLLETDCGVMITASHNPPEYNGLKFVKKHSVPMGYESGLNIIEEIISNGDYNPLASVRGTYETMDISEGFIKNLRRFYNPANIKKMKVVVNSGNGCAGLMIDKLEPLLPVTLIKIFNEPDSSFPNGVPNPMLEESRTPTINAIKEHKADLGVAWDGDYDRCFFFDEHGNFIEGYYIVGLLAKSILLTSPGGNIVHDPRLTWNTLDIVTKAGGNPVQSKSGHAFIKEKMREVNSVYGGEMSAHHYFRDNAYSDSGLIPFLLVMELMSVENKKLSELVEEMINQYPCSGEINSKIADPAAKIKEIEEKYTGGIVDKTDGVSIEYDDWRFNLRMSNTEPIIRLNVETKGNKDLLKEKTEELLALIRN